jgi:tight adherence protein C
MSVALAALAGFLAAAGIVDLAGSRRKRPSDRLAPLIALGRRIAPARAPKDLAERLELAGAPLSPTDASALKAGGAAAAGLVGALLAAGAHGRLGLALAPACACAGFFALDVWLAAKAHGRATAMAIELPDVLDLLRVALAAGLPPTRALHEVGSRHRGVLAAELARAAAQVQVGVPRHEALARLRRRAPQTAALATVLDRADRLGAPPAEALVALARDARESRARTRAEQAAKAAPKIQLVVALLLVPSVMLLVAAALAPALLTAV